MLVALFPLSVLKRLVNKSFEFSCIEKEHDKKSQIMTYLRCRLDHKLLFGPLGSFMININTEGQEKRS